MSPSNLTLSKSDYILYLAHPAWLWLKKHDKDKLPPLNDNLQNIFDRGHAFETYAQQLFKDGKTLGFKNYEDYKLLLQKTQDELIAKTKTIFQARFEIDNLTCIVDILDRVKDNTYDLIEVKSSTQAKPEHILDLAFQTVVLEKTGVTVRNISVMHANNQYVRNGAIEADQFVVQTDVTDEVRLAIPDTLIGISQALKTAMQPTIPDISPRFANSGALRDWLEVYVGLKPELDKYSIYALSGRSIAQITQLEELGIQNMDQIPDDFKLSPKQKNQVKCIKTDTRIIHNKSIHKFLDTFEYPLYFLDYETLGDLIPPFDGMKPYLQIPFQYSLHKIQAPRAKVEHFEYLHLDSTNPSKDLTKQLQKDIGEQGTILAWNAGFEQKMNLTVADMLPDYKDFYLGINDRIKDLMWPFAKSMFVDKDFFGSASLKKVQPVLVPELSYQQLDVSDGMLAQRIWMDTFLYGKNENNKDEIVANLLKYCLYDTLVMVKIYQLLQQL